MMLNLSMLALLVCSGGSMDIQYIHWYGQSAFRIEDGAMQMYIDPFKLPEQTFKADIVFITHAHYDHFSPEDIAKIQKDKTIFVAPQDVAAKIKGKVVAVEPGKRYTIGKLKIQTVPAYNINKKFHPKANAWVGYIITLSNGEKIYHAGDTDFIPEMKNIVTDIALLPCGGTYTMTAKEAAEAANTFKPKLLIPMHYGSIVGTKADADTVKKLFKGSTEILTPER
jgi:L-ascorbate metabolism protein UlaG (beta-lactamase superfamily)